MIKEEFCSDLSLFLWKKLNLDWKGCTFHLSCISKHLLSKPTRRTQAQIGYPRKCFHLCHTIWLLVNTEMFLQHFICYLLWQRLGFIFKAFLWHFLWSPPRVLEAEHLMFQEDKWSYGVLKLLLQDPEEGHLMLGYILETNLMVLVSETLTRFSPDVIGLLNNTAPSHASVPCFVSYIYVHKIVEKEY